MDAILHSLTLQKRTMYKKIFWLLTHLSNIFAPQIKNLEMYFAILICFEFWPMCCLWAFAHSVIKALSSSLSWEFTFCSIWTVQISENENSLATKKLRYRALSPLSSPLNAAQNIYFLLVHISLKAIFTWDFQRQISVKRPWLSPWRTLVTLLFLSLRFLVSQRINRRRQWEARTNEPENL